MGIDPFSKSPLLYCFLLICNKSGTEHCHDVTEHCHDVTEHCHDLTEHCHDVTEHCHDVTEHCHDVTQTPVSHLTPTAAAPVSCYSIFSVANASCSLLK